MAFPKITKIAFDIMGRSWSICLVTWKKYRRIDTSDSIAVTHGHNRKLYLSPGGRDIETIRHELFHAYLFECCLHSASGIGRDDMEEICSDLFAFRGIDILKQADDLYTKVIFAMNGNTKT